MTDLYPTKPAPDTVCTLSDTIDQAIVGLSTRPKTLPCKLLYDQRGSALFDRICSQPEYYQTRTELAILKDNIGDICEALGPEATLIELGSGSAAKTRIMLDGMKATAAYRPIDISSELLFETAADLSIRYPRIQITPVHADFTGPFRLPKDPGHSRRRVAFFPGSTIGNFHPQEASALMQRLRRAIRPNGAILIGIDLIKSPNYLLPAYNDRAGLTAQFNRNVLYHLRNAYGARVDPEGFAHEARWNNIAGRIEMHLVAKESQHICLDGCKFYLEKAESIWTESCYKYTVKSFTDLCEGFALRKVWTDPNRWFALLYMTVETGQEYNQHDMKHEPGRYA